MGLAHVGEHLGGRAVVGEIDRDVGGGQLVGELSQALLAACDQHQLRPRLARQAPGRGLADAARRAGDEEDL